MVQHLGLSQKKRQPQTNATILRRLFRRKVQKGTQLGRKLGFPTINLRVGRFGDHFRQGVYICEVVAQGRYYVGLLYFGPKLTRRGKVLEIYIHRFSGNLYGQWVRFTIGRYLRDAKKFTSLSSLKKQMQKDLNQL